MGTWMEGTRRGICLSFEGGMEESCDGTQLLRRERGRYFSMDKPWGSRGKEREMVLQPKGRSDAKTGKKLIQLRLTTKKKEKPKRLNTAKNPEKLVFWFDDYKTACEKRGLCYFSQLTSFSNEAGKKKYQQQIINCSWLKNRDWGTSLGSREEEKIKKRITNKVPLFGSSKLYKQAGE